jgi:hypothetical protein
MAVPKGIVDLSRIEGVTFKENWLLLLGFPTRGGRAYVPLRVIGREFFFYEYDPIEEGQISVDVPAGVKNGAAANTSIDDLGFVQPARLSSQFLTGHPFDVFEIPRSKRDRLFQLFYGIAPQDLRIFLNYPDTTGQRNLEIATWSSANAQFGYIDGYDSPTLYPSPQSEIIVPPALHFALGYGNLIPTPVNPLLLFWVNHLEVELITEIDLVERMLRGTVPVAIRTMGGLSSYTYNIEDVYGIPGVPLSATKEEIAAGIGVTPAPRTTVAPATVTTTTRSAYRPPRLLR